MTQGPFLLRLCQRGAFTGFSADLFFAVHLCRSGKPSVTARAMNGTSRHGRRANRKNAVSDDPNEFEPTDTAYFFWWCLPCFTLPAWFPFFFSVVSFRYGFLWGIFFSQYASASVYLHFAPFSEPHQAVISVLGAKVIPGLDGKARSSLLFSGKISSPAGSIFPQKPTNISSWFKMRELWVYPIFRVMVWQQF